jgi:hypothetical protein
MRFWGGRGTGILPGDVAYVRHEEEMRSVWLRHLQVSIQPSSGCSFALLVGATYTPVPSVAVGYDDV